MIKCNYEYFKKIDTQEKAYWLGFLMADGCIGKYHKSGKDGRIQINISSKDRCIIEKFRECLNSDFKIIDYIPKTTYASNEMSKMMLSSINMCKDLSKYGIASNKTGK